MRLIAVGILLAVACFGLTRSQASETSAEDLDIVRPPFKLDKNARQLLLKALSDLEAESAEQRKDEDEKSLVMAVEETFDDVVKKNLNKNIGVIPKATTFSFDGFPGDEEGPNEEKLQNSSFVESQRYVSTTSPPAMTIEKASHEDARSFHVHNVVAPDSSAKVDRPPESPRKASSASSSSLNKVVESVTLKPITQVSESLTQSASSGIASANGLVVPKPTASSPTVSPNLTVSPVVDGKKPQAEEVKIFQAPLVAAFTVQQDELGVPKSVVPIYRQSGDGQALTLQEQLEFKQKLLEQQLVELQQQQYHQTQFLLRQRQLYEQQARQKQHQLYLQEQARIKQLEEQARIKQLEEQAKIKQLEEQRYRQQQLEEQRLYRLHNHNFPVQKPFIFEHTNALALQSPVAEHGATVRLQPSVSLEVPSVAAPPLFRAAANYQEQLHFQQLRPLPPQPLQSQQQQQRLQQSFGTAFPSNDFQPPVVAPATRFNRQEAFNAVGNFGFNLDNKQPPPSPPSRNAFSFNAPLLPRYPATNTFVYNPYVQYRQQPVPVNPTRSQTPAKQIQHLLYQSGVAGELGNVHGTAGHEDLNIVSKVLALNVGALPANNYQQYSASNRGKLGGGSA